MRTPPPALVDIFKPMPRPKLKRLLGCKDSLASEVARGKKSIKSTRALASVTQMLINEYGEAAAARILLASLRQWYPEVLTSEPTPTSAAA